MHAPPEVAISPDADSSLARARTAGWAYAEGFVPEDEVLLRARERAAELGCHAVLPGAGALLRVLAASLAARAVVEVGTGTGVAALWLLRGMPADGVLTTIDAEQEHLRAAKRAFAEEGLAPSRTRAIPGRPQDVLPRLTDRAYDMVLVGADPHAYPDYVTEALRLLRPGGVLAVDGALHGGRVADPARRDEVTTLVRELGRSLRADDRVVPALVPAGDGLLLGVRR
ncbi:O-methyltransferase [Puerhibacterium puerhi]|uniref:O-methyltransferase n=1 Tax=Puerhibacterium puerhi TaxID=2692623 RepID=UPI0038B606B0